MNDEFCANIQFGCNGCKLGKVSDTHQPKYTRGHKN